MADVTIEALKPVTFPKPRAVKRRLKDAETDFRRWLSQTSETGLNDDEPPAGVFNVPLMSAEGILILAQAHEEEFEFAARMYEEAAAHFPEEPEQLAMDLFVVVDEEI